MYSFHVSGVKFNRWRIDPFARQFICPAERARTGQVEPLKSERKSSIGKHLSLTRRQDACHRKWRAKGISSAFLGGFSGPSFRRLSPLSTPLARYILFDARETTARRGVAASRIPPTSAEGTILGDSISPVNRIRQSSNPASRLRRPTILCLSFGDGCSTKKSIKKLLYSEIVWKNMFWKGILIVKII